MDIKIDGTYLTVRPEQGKRIITEYDLLQTLIVSDITEEIEGQEGEEESTYYRTITIRSVWGTFDIKLSSGDPDALKLHAGKVEA